MSQSLQQQSSIRPDEIIPFRKLIHRANVQHPGRIPPEIANAFVFDPAKCSSVMEAVNRLKLLKNTENPWFLKILKSGNDVFVWSKRKQEMHSALNGSLVEIPTSIEKYIIKNISAPQRQRLQNRIISPQQLQQKQGRQTVNSMTTDQKKEERSQKMLGSERTPTTSIKMVQQSRDSTPYKTAPSRYFLKSLFRKK